MCAWDDCVLVLALGLQTGRAFVACADLGSDLGVIILLGLPTGISS